MNRLEQLISLNEQKLTPEDVIFIHDCLSDADALIRSEAIFLLAECPHSDDKEILISMCDDEDVLVRTEAYDALSEYFSASPADEIPLRLEQAILTDADALSRSYAIMAWADTQAGFYPDISQQIQFMQTQKAQETSEECILCCVYALYQFHNPGALAILLSYLHHKDYAIRCSAVNCLDTAVREEDLPQVCRIFRKHLETEPARAVSSAIETFLRKHQKN